jgi:hypothetical protein
VRDAGGDTPQIAFMTPFVPSNKVVREIYDYLYAPGLYRDLWFMWDGKPLVLANIEAVPDADLRAFFTIRTTQPDMFMGQVWPPTPDGEYLPDMWCWLEVFPTHVYRDAEGNAEMMGAGIGQNAVGDRLCAFSEPGTRGRSWHNGAMDTRPDAVRYGLNWQEQWDRALKEDPELIYATAWNEWTALRLPGFGNVSLPVAFVDDFTQEYSRDAEPMVGGHGDDYYLQLAANVRRFKGARPIPPASAPKTIDLAGDWAQWDEVGPAFRSYRGDTAHRDATGYGDTHYVNTTGRNDIVAAKVARDDEYIYFHIETAEAITEPAADHWMTVFIDLDGDGTNGWHGYDYVINRVAPIDGEALVEAHGAQLPGAAATDWVWRPACKAPLRVEGNRMMLAVPRWGLIMPESHALRFDFKVVDNFMAQPRAEAEAAGDDPAAVEADIMDFYVSGDAAPLGRFNWRYAVE